MQSRPKRFNDAAVILGSIRETLRTEQHAPSCFGLIQSLCKVKMTNQKETFHAMKWPDEFIVEFKNGKEQTFVSSKGLYWNDGGDLGGENENRANITCAWKKKSLNQQKYKLVEFFVDEVNSFKTVTGHVIWNPNA